MYMGRPLAPNTAIFASCWDDIDAVCIGTPDHRHAAQAIAAIQAGKDIYVEKPLTLTVAEGRRLVKVAEAYGRVIQTGL
jgi:predicted dehydrogenase